MHISFQQAIPTQFQTLLNFLIISEFQQKYYGMVDWPKQPTLHEQKATVYPRGSNEYYTAVKNTRK